jgi:hypothetical protein
VRPDALVTRTADEPERHLRTGRAVTPCHTSETTGPAPKDSRRAFRTIANDIEPAIENAGSRDYRPRISDWGNLSTDVRVGALLRVATNADLDAIVDVDGGDQFAVASLACSISFTKRVL